MLRINYGRLATGLVFLALFFGFELHIPAIQHLIPGSYAGLTSGNYLGFVFLLSALGALGGSVRSERTYPASPAGGTVDPHAVAAAMLAMQANAGRPAPSAAGTVPCPTCGAANLGGARFCQGCGKSFVAPGSP